MKLKNLPVLVYGLGVSGLETIKFLQKRKAKVYIYDDCSFFKIDNAQWIEQNQDLSFLKLAIVSPGISDTKFLTKLRMYNVPIYSELKFASQFLKKKLIAVSGTNGKTTVVSLLGKILNDCGKSTMVCGNIGKPLISCIDNQSRYKYFVCEVSSFQLENEGHLKPFVSVLLNIQPDHLERHKSMQVYQDLKFSMFKHQKKHSYAVTNKNLKNKYMLYGFKNLPIVFSAYQQADAYCIENKLYYKDIILDTEKISLMGKKNYENILACMIVAKICKVKTDQIIKSICQFESLPHRVQFVRSLMGVKYFNDSKATNPDSTNCALECFEKDVILLLGGYDKKLDYSSIFVCNKNIKSVIAFGDARESIAVCAFDNGFENVNKCASLKEAILKAYEIACSGDTVLLSPACSSFDEFKNFEQRGDFFVNFVNGL